MGYQPPTILRRDLGLTQMIQVLRENRDGWHLYKDLGRPSFIKFSPVSDSEGYNSFVDGLFAHTPGSSRSDEGYKATIHFYQLASINKGIGYKHWYHHVDCNIKYIAIQPELDLLVLLSYAGTMWSPDDVPHQIHLRTISTNAPHPLAASPIINLKVARASRYDLGFQNNLVQIHGRMIGVRFGSYHNPTLKPLVMVWNWVLGVEVVHLKLKFRPGREYSMTFISEEYILVPKFAEPLKGTRSNYDQIGRLDVYRIPLGDMITSLGYHVASFILADPAERQDYVYLEVSTSPSPAPDSTQFQPKIYELAPGNRLIHIYILTSIENKDLSSGASHRAGLHGLLYVSTNVLLDLLNRICHPDSASAPVSIPWSEWGCHASWVSWEASNYMNGFTWGQRHAFRYNVKVETRQNRYISCKRFCILDHSRKRVKFASQGTAGISETMRSERQTRSVVVDMSDDIAETPPYIEPLSGGFESMVIDDEHLVVLVPNKQSPEALAGLLVYNIGRSTPDASVVLD
ncbi:hypothetical protein RSAG8_11985, partial [Rhizoctonia solani AG-8 WAC10335]